MLILSHRNYKYGFGVETDIRDYKGELVISHDIADENCRRVEDFLESHCGINPELFIAFNIKADGLQGKLKELLLKYKLLNYFVFDMSVPDALGYLKLGINAFTRQSEHETIPSFYKGAQGVWVDGFTSEWVDESTIRGHLEQGKQVCLVSPELHGRSYGLYWRKLLDMKVINDPGLIICTDYPEEAREVFSAKN